MNQRPFGPEPNALPNCATPRKNGANVGTRTPDLLITNQLLYRLSYIGNSCFSIIGNWHFGVKTFVSNYSAKNFTFGRYRRIRKTRSKKKHPRSNGCQKFARVFWKIKAWERCFARESASAPDTFSIPSRTGRSRPPPKYRPRESAIR